MASTTRSVTFAPSSQLAQSIKFRRAGSRKRALTKAGKTMHEKIVLDMVALFQDCNHLDSLILGKPEYDELWAKMQSSLDKHDLTLLSLHHSFARPMHSTPNGDCRIECKFELTVT